MVVGLSFCLLGTEGFGGSWAERHRPFLAALALGLLLSALYVRVSVGQDGRSVGLTLGLWPLRLNRELSARRVTGVLVDAGGMRTFVLYKAYILWTSDGGRERRLLMTMTGPEAVRSALVVARALDVPVTTTDAFWERAGEEGRSLIAEAGVRNLS